jgi:drug/metabolite transporter (DMT)-like permease
VSARPGSSAAPTVTASPTLARARPGALALTWSDGAALLAVLLWGSNFSVSKDLMTLLPPLEMTFLRAAMSALVFVVALGVTPGARLPRRRDVLPFVACGALGMALNSYLWATGLHLTTASHSGLIFTVTPLLVYVLSHLLGHLRIGRRDSLGLGLGLAGAVLIVGAPLLTGGEGDGASPLGDGLTAVSAIIWGLWTLLAMSLLRRYDTLRSTAWLTTVSALTLLPLALPGLLAFPLERLSAGVIVAFFYSGIVAGVAGGLLWYSAVRRLGAARTMVYANMESFFAVLFAALLLGERVEVTALVGGIAVIAGVVLTRRRQAPER